MSLQTCYVIKIYIPVQLDELESKPISSTIPLRQLPYVAKIIDVIAASDTIGRLGSYANVVEITEGEEWYTPYHTAHPRLGEANRESGVHSVVLTTYAVQTNLHELNMFIEQVVQVHPWEHPVIECIGPQGPLVWLPFVEPSHLSLERESPYVEK